MSHYIILDGINERGLRIGGPVPAGVPSFGVDSLSWLLRPSESPATVSVKNVKRENEEMKYSCCLMHEAVRDVLKNNSREIGLLSLEPNRTCELLEKIIVVQFLPGE